MRNGGGARTVAAVIYLVVGLDRDTLTPWHDNVGAGDAATAKQIARSRARAVGIDLVIARRDRRPDAALDRLSANG